MGTDLLLAPTARYRDVLATLPEGVRVLCSFEPDGESFRIEHHPHPGDPPFNRPLYMFPIAHVLLIDKCGNTLWMHEATEHDVEHKIARTVGEAAFDKFGLQGSILHFGEAFEDQRHVLFDAIFIHSSPDFDADEAREAGYGTWDQCGFHGDDDEERHTCFQCKPV